MVTSSFSLSDKKWPYFRPCRFPPKSLAPKLIATDLDIHHWNLQWDIPVVELYSYTGSDVGNALSADSLDFEIGLITYLAVSIGTNADRY